MLGRKQAQRAAHWLLAALTGVWLRVMELEFSICLWAKWLRKDFLCYTGT